jgi:putative endopeptidase
VLSDLAQQRTRAVLETAAAGTAAAGSDERKIGDYYASYMDEQAIEAKALSPLRDELNSIAGISDQRALAAWIGSSLRADVDPLNNAQFHTDRLFGIWISQDLNNPARNVPYLLQGGSACRIAIITSRSRHKC